MSDALVPYDPSQEDSAQNTINPYLDLVTWEHQKPKYLDTILHSIRGHAQTIERLIRLYELFDIDTAVGQQLDYVGQWVGVTRYISTEMENVFFSWDRDKVGWEQGTWWQPFTNTTELFKLEDEHYRLLLRARIVSNQWDGTIPGAYTAWDTLFGPDGYHVLIQDGMASISSVFKFDAYAYEGWDHAAWQRYNTPRANFLRNSTMVGARVSGGDTGLPTTLPIYWDVRTGLDITVTSIYTLSLEQKINVITLNFSGDTIGTFTDIYFEEVGPDYLKVVPGQVFTLSAYFQVIADSGITHDYRLIVRTHQQDGTFNRDYEGSLDQAPTVLKRESLTFTVPNHVETMQVGLRFYHADAQYITSFEILIGQPQLELGNQATAPINTEGSATVVFDPKLPEGHLNSAGHMIYALIAPYTPPPPPPEYFSWDQFTSHIELGELTNDKIYAPAIIDNDLAVPPTGLTICLPCSEETGMEVANSIPVAASSNLLFYNNEDIGLIGYRFGSQGYATYSWSGFSSQPPSTWTIEVLLYVSNADDGYIAGFTTFSTIAGISDRTLYIKDGKFGVYVGGGGGPEHIEFGTVEAGVTYHVIVTCSPPTVTITIKDQGSASFTTSPTGGRVDYNNTTRSTERNDPRIDQTGNTRMLEEPTSLEGMPFFAIGLSRRDIPYSYLPQTLRAFNGVMLLANVLSSIYTTQAIADRFANPYGFLWWQQADVETITYIDYAKGWDAGMWDVTPALVAPPPIDAVTMALFTGGYIDLRPAGVTIEYVTQSLAGTPIFAFDDCTGDQQIDMNYLTWDDNDYNGWDSAVWDLTPVVYNTDFPAPPFYVAGFDIGAWGTFNYTAPPLELPTPARQLVDLREAA